MHWPAPCPGGGTAPGLAPVPASSHVFIARLAPAPGTVSDFVGHRVPARGLGNASLFDVKIIANGHGTVVASMNQQRKWTTGHPQPIEIEVGWPYFCIYVPQSGVDAFRRAAVDHMAGQLPGEASDCGDYGRDLMLNAIPAVAVRYFWEEHMKAREVVAVPSARLIDFMARLRRQGREAATDAVRLRQEHARTQRLTDAVAGAGAARIAIASNPLGFLFR